MWKYALAITMLITTAAASAAVDINLASVADLDGIKGIGPAVSSRILKERQKGPFKSWNDFITRVKGIGANNAARLSSEGLTVDGVAYTVLPGSTARKTIEATTVTGSVKK